MEKIEVFLLAISELCMGSVGLKSTCLSNYKQT